MTHGEMEEVSACRVSVRLSRGVVPQVPPTNTEGCGGEERRAHGGTAMRVEGRRDYRARRYGRSCALGSGDAAADSGIRTDGDIEGQDSYQTVQEISWIEGTSLLGEQISGAEGIA